MPELTTKRLVDYLNGPGVDAAILKASLISAGTASTEQGALADTALQPDDVGSAAHSDVADFATSEQGDLADGALQAAQNLTDLADLALAQNIMQVGAIFADIATAMAAIIPARNKSLRTQFYDLTAMVRVEGAKYKRISLADLAAYPALSYFRSADRYMPDGTIDATNGGYWVFSDPIISPLQIGARLNSATFDSGPMLQAAIDLGSIVGIPCILPIGTLYTAQTIHVYAQSVLCGHGKSQSFLKAKDGADIGVLETYNFSILTGTAAKFVTDAGMTWGFSLRGFTVDGNRQVNYGGVSGTRFAGVGSVVWDGFGIRLYGRRYIVEDVAVQYCAGIGFYSECGNPSSPSPANWYYNALNDQQGSITDLVVSDCSYDGFVFRGPGDILIDDVTAELCFYPDETLYGTLRNSLMFPSESISGIVFADQASNSAVAGCEIGFIHSHTHKNGYGIRFEGNVFQRVRTDNLTSEGSLGGIKVRGQVLGQFNKVNVRNQNFGSGALPDFDLLTTDLLMISEYENRGSTGNAGSTKLLIGSDKTQFGTITIHGGVAGHGVVVDTNVDHVTINQMYIHDLRGTAQDGNASRSLWTKSGAANIYIGTVMLVDNQVGWRNDSTGDIVISRGRIEGNATTYPGIVAIDLASSPAFTSLKQCGFNTNDGTSSKFPTFNGAVSIDPTNATSEIALTWTHNMWRTPQTNEVGWNYVTNGTTRPGFGYLEITATSSTTVTGRMKFSSAGNGTSGGSAAIATV
ncbi:hypothetical protein [Rhizobium sp. BK602]|uniref:hypothetical protein n=1 Tax=Rhizobium sp. BK602 TaxID=2586986 RepID=UPI00160AFA6E|nr:hypothetical protein [Rhizobium sp. BK602]MBB3608683.1 hypothetical protein [Rhizobium sp. BK602]